MAVNKERVELLCQALESGEFQQAHDALRDDSSWDGAPVRYCCLGVATVVALRGVEGDLTPDEVNRHPIWTMGPGDDEWGTLPPTVAQWYGLPSQSGEPVLNVSVDPDLVLEDGLTKRASVVNDELRCEFPEIAAAFRRTYLEEQP